MAEELRRAAELFKGSRRILLEHHFEEEEANHRRANRLFFPEEATGILARLRAIR